MTAALSRRFDDRRNLLSKIHIAKKQLGLDDDTYRARLARITGKSSSADMTEAELEAVLKDFAKDGFKAVKKAFTGPAAAQATVITALWMSGWNLGVIRDPSPQAMEAFILRQTGVAKAEWLVDAKLASKVIDGLKAWLARAAHVDFKKQPSFGIAAFVNWPQYRMCLAQWQALLTCGAVTKSATWTGNDKSNAEEMLAYARAVVGKGPSDMTERDFITVQMALGKKLRKALEGE
jgi:Protein of unknown function (DUF1018)